MFLPRLRPLKGHERLYGSCKNNCIYFVQSSTGECKYIPNQVIVTRNKYIKLVHSGFLYRVCNTIDTNVPVSMFQKLVQS